MNRRVHLEVFNERDYPADKKAGAYPDCPPQTFHVSHLNEGRAQMQIEQKSYTLETADTCCAPGYTEVSLRNLSPSERPFCSWPKNQPCTAS
jgi:hypothetical protein